MEIQKTATIAVGIALVVSLGANAFLAYEIAKKERSYYAIAESSSYAQQQNRLSLESLVSDTKINRSLLKAIYLKQCSRI